MIDEAKRKAAAANDTAKDTMDKLNAIKEEIDKINVTPGDSNLNNALNDVDDTGEILDGCLCAHEAVVYVDEITTCFHPLTFYLQ